jgi:hypothetical protein
VVLSQIFGRLAIRRAERLLDRIENYALELDLRRSMIAPWFEAHPSTRPAIDPASPPAGARRN